MQGNANEYKSFAVRRVCQVASTKASHSAPNEGFKPNRHLARLTLNEEQKTKARNPWKRQNDNIVILSMLIFAAKGPPGFPARVVSYPLLQQGPYTQSNFKQRMSQ